MTPRGRTGPGAHPRSACAPLAHDGFFLVTGPAPDPYILRVPCRRFFCVQRGFGPNASPPIIDGCKPRRVAHNMFTHSSRAAPRFPLPPRLGRGHSALFSRAPFAAAVFPPRMRPPGHRCSVRHRHCPESGPRNQRTCPVIADRYHRRQKLAVIRLVRRDKNPGASARVAHLALLGIIELSGRNPSSRPPLQAQFRGPGQPPTFELPRLRKAGCPFVYDDVVRKTTRSSGPVPVMFDQHRPGGGAAPGRHGTLVFGATETPGRRPEKFDSVKPQPGPSSGLRPGPLLRDLMATTQLSKARRWVPDRAEMCCRPVLGALQHRDRTWIDNTFSSHQKKRHRRL